MANPFYERDGITLLHADCRDVLPTLGKVDAVITDPPYGVREDEWDDMDEQEFARFNMVWLSQSRALSDTLCVFAGDQTRYAIESLCRDLYPKVRLLIWDKPIGSQYAGAADSGLWYAHEAIFHCNSKVSRGELLSVGQQIKGAREAKGLSRGAVDLLVRGKKTGLCYRWEEGSCLPTPQQAEIVCEALGINLPKALNGEPTGRDVLTYRTVTSGIHPCEKPVPLLVDLLSTALDGKQRLCDPFAGSCSTGSAAWQLGRECILIEQDERYCEAGAKRLDAEISRGRLFEPQPELREQSALEFE